MLEWRLGVAKAINYRGDLSQPPCKFERIFLVSKIIERFMKSYFSGSKSERNKEIRAEENKAVSDLRRF